MNNGSDALTQSDCAYTPKGRLGVFNELLKLVLAWIWRSVSPSEEEAL
jgi:hypothetical protein